MKHVTITIDFDVEEGVITKSFVSAVIKEEIFDVLILEKRTEAINLKVKTKISK